MGRLYGFAVLFLLVLATAGPVLAQASEDPWWAAVEDPKITVEFRRLNMRDAFGAIFKEAPGWTYSIHPNTPIPNDAWFDVHFIDLPLSWCVRGLISGHDIGYTAIDTHYYIHAKGYVVPEPSSMLALLSGVGGAWWFGRLYTKKRPAI